MILIRAKIIVHTEFQLSAERLVERLVFLSVFFQQALQLAFDFFADVFRDQLQLAVMLGSISLEMFSDRSSESTMPFTKLKWSGSRSAHLFMISTPLE